MSDHQKKIRVAVLFGGRSGEHEISLRSAASVVRYLDRNRFDVIPVGVDKEGRWLLNDTRLLDNSLESLPIPVKSPQVVLPPNRVSGDSNLVSFTGKNQGIDVVFPVMHGPLCEDGTVQGLFELADIPYVGSGVLSSSVSMDKDFAKRLIRDAGLPIVPYFSLKGDSWKKGFSEFSQKVGKELGYPVFVKPANLGSSVGIHKVKEHGQLEAAIEDAFRFDTKVIVEKGIDAREIELAVLEDLDWNKPPLVTFPGEIVPSHEFYSYEAKYIDQDGAKLLIPAPLSPSDTELARKLGGQAFEILGCEGMARVDLFLDKKSGAFYFNEVNTIPGFTSISMYPKMWEHYGLSYSDLLSRLIDLALVRHARKKKLVREYQ